MFMIAVFLLLTGGVFGETECEKKAVPVSMSVMEGEPVLLPTSVQTQGIISKDWWFVVNNVDIAGRNLERFKGRAQQHENGSLHIMKMTTEHAGLYKVLVDLTTGPLCWRFNVIVNTPLSPGAKAGIVIVVLLMLAAAAVGVFYFWRRINKILQQNLSVEEKRVMVKSGDSVTLTPDVKLQTGDQILWTFGPQETQIAQLREGYVKIFDSADGRFKDRLALDDTTGSLTITNTTAEHAGVYNLQTISSKVSLCQRFTLTVKLEKSVTKKEGESVTLNPDVKLQKDDQILWMFGPQETQIAEVQKGAAEIFYCADKRFRNRLKLNTNTGALTITDLSAEHAGVYKLLTNSSTANLCVCVTVTVRWQFLSELEGKSVELCPDTQIEKEDQVVWMFGDQEQPIAKLMAKNKEYHGGEDGRFLDRLKLDKNTGSLTITNTRAKHSGLYKLQISNSTRTTYKKFRVFFEVKKVEAKEGSRVIIKKGDEIQKNDLVQWLFGDESSLIAELKGGSGEITTSNDKRFKDRLTLDTQTGSLTITNITTEHAGVYKLKINSGKALTNNSFNVVVRARMILGKNGKTVTLNPDADVQREDLILWTFGNEERLIAQLTAQTEEMTYINTDERFRDRLTLNKNTGALSVSNITPGLYKLQISSSSTKSSVEKFRVFLCCNSPSKTVSAIEGETFIFITDFTIERGEKVQWRFENEPLASGADGDVSKTSYSGGERFRDRLELHHHSGSLSVRNSRSSDSGVYQLLFRNTCCEFSVTV